MILPGGRAKDEAKSGNAQWVSLIAVGTSLNAVGIALTSLGWFRFVLMGAGVLVLLVCVVKLVSAQKSTGDHSDLQR